MLDLTRVLAGDDAAHRRRRLGHAVAFQMADRQSRAERRHESEAEDDDRLGIDANHASVLEARRLDGVKRRG